MTYTKPELVLLAPATDVINSGTTKNAHMADSLAQSSDAAYEADE